MTAIASALMLWSFTLPAAVQAPPADDEELRALHRITDQFETDRRAAIEATRYAGDDEALAAARRMTPDARQSSRDLLALARDARDQAIAVDALVWVLRHVGRHPEWDQALRQIGERHLLSDRIAGAFGPIASRAGAGGPLLLRIVEQNPDEATRGQACLALALARRRELRDVLRLSIVPADSRAGLVQSLGGDRLGQMERSDPDALIAEAERWLGRAVEEFPRALLGREVSDFFPLLADDLGRNSERALRRAAESHPEAMTRREAECALIVQQMKLALLASEIAGTGPGDRPNRGLAEVAGGAARIGSIDAQALAEEIERRLGGLSEHVREFAEPAVCFLRLIRDMGSNGAYYAGAERLLRRASEGHPDGPIRTAARRSLAFHLAGMADESGRLRLTGEAELVRRKALLGERRVAEIRGMDPAPVNREAVALARQLVEEGRGPGGRPDGEVEALLRRLGLTSVGSVAPEIEGSDIEGRPFELGDYRGRVVVLDFWNHRTCLPCRQAYPTLRELAATFAGRRFALLGVDTDDEREELARLSREGEVSWRFWFRHGTAEEPTFARWDIPSIPSVILLDHRGVIRARYEGTPGPGALKLAVESLVKEAESEAGPVGGTGPASR